MKRPAWPAAPVVPSLLLFAGLVLVPAAARALRKDLTTSA